MKILLLGTTGRTGKSILDIAIEMGHEVNCLSRKSTRIPQQHGVTVFEGNPSNEQDLETAMSGCEVMISALNISRKTDFPWSGIRTPKTYLSDVASNMVAVAEGKNLKRVVVCSAWGVSETARDLPKWFKWFIDNSNIGVAYRDHERQEDILMNSNLNWTIVRPAGLINSRRAEKVKESFNNKPKPSLMISRRSVARYMLESSTNDLLSKKTVVISRA